MANESPDKGSNTNLIKCYFFSVQFKFNKSRQGMEQWDNEILVFDAITADELNLKIKNYMNSEFKSYRDSMKVVEIIKL